MAQRHCAEAACALRAAMSDADMMHIGLALLRTPKQVTADALHVRYASHVLAFASRRPVAHDG